MTVTLTIADDLASQLKPYEAELSEILKLGIREWRARSEAGYSGIRDLCQYAEHLVRPAKISATKKLRDTTT